jgi:hypothetical protein
MEIQKGYNFFQYLGPTKCRHICLYHTDPKIGYVPNALMNWLMTNVLYGNCCRLQEKSEAINKKEVDEEQMKIAHWKDPMYEYFLQTMLEP